MPFSRAQRGEPAPLRSKYGRAHASAALAVACLISACGRIGYDEIGATGLHGGSLRDGGGGSGATSGAGGVGTTADASAGGSGGAGRGSGGGSGSGGGNASAGGSGGGSGNAGGSGSGGAGGSGGGGGTGGAGGVPACGDGVVQTGEACDDRVASATCNADCSFASCGDGKLNAAAGEACDAGDDLTSCTVTCELETCRAGCTCEWYLGHRYMLCPDSLVYTAAQTACGDFGMRLVRIDSGHENSFLRLRSQLAAFPKFHIGARDVGQEGTWVWDDGTTYWTGGPTGAAVAGKFAFWAAGEPNDQNANEDCAEIQAVQGWNDAVCVQGKPFICEQYRDPRPTCGNGTVEAGEACDGGGATSTCDADCSPVVCGDGLVNAAAGELCDDAATGQYCNATCTQYVCPAGCQCFTTGGSDYALCTTGELFREAEVFCGRHGMSLTILGDVTEDQAVRSRVTAAGTGEYWAGGTDLDAEGQWMWLDTTRFWSGSAAVAYQHFVPPPTGGTTRNCLLVATDGTWRDIDCAYPSPFVCERVVP